MKFDHFVCLGTENGIGPSGATALASAMASNYSLQSLDVRGGILPQHFPCSWKRRVGPIYPTQTLLPFYFQATRGSVMTVVSSRNLLWRRLPATDAKDRRTSLHKATVCLLFHLMRVSNIRAILHHNTNRYITHNAPKKHLAKINHWFPMDKQQNNTQASPLLPSQKSKKATTHYSNAFQSMATWCFNAVGWPFCAFHPTMFCIKPPRFDDSPQVPSREPRILSVCDRNRRWYLWPADAAKLSIVLLACSVYFHISVESPELCKEARGDLSPPNSPPPPAAFLTPNILE